MKQRTQNILLFFGIPFLGFLFDFLTKQLVIAKICMENTIVPVLPFFQLVCVLNTGVSFGIFAGVAHGKYILLAVTLCILVFMYFLMYKEKSVFVKYCYSVIISGAFGNIIDRTIHSGVIDFLDFYYKNHHYPAFNVADSLIFIGVCGIVLQQMFNKKS